VTTVAPSQNAVFDALAGKASSSHTHALSDITQSGATTGQVIKWDGSSWVPDSDSNSGTWGSISGTLSDQTDLQSALDAKVASSGLSELVDDRVAALLVAGTNVTLTYNDGANTLTIAASGGGSSNSYVPGGW